MQNLLDRNMLERKLSRKEFEENLKILLNQEYPAVKYQNHDSYIADFLEKTRSLRKMKRISHL